MTGGGTVRTASTVTLVSAVAGVASAAVVGGPDLSGGEVVRGITLAAWAIAGFTMTRARPVERLGPVVGLAVAFAAAGHLAAGVDRHRSVDGWVADVLRFGGALAFALVAPLVVALLSSVPTGRLSTRRPRTFVAVATAVTVALAAGAYANWPDVPLGWATTVAVAGLVVAGPAAHRRYRSASAADRRRLQWLGLAVAVLVEAALVLGAFDVVIGWPGHLDEVMLGLSSLVPLGLALGVWRRLEARIDRVLAATVTGAGLTAVVVATYVIVVLGFGERPDDNERTAAVIPIVGVAVATVIFLPMRDRLVTAASRLVYGEQQAPEESLRTFGQRMTRAIPMDELLLQLVESLRKTMRLASAEVWTGVDGQYLIAAGVPHRQADPLLVGAKERPIVARAGVSGGTWLDIWLPALTADRESSLVRVAPLAHAGELLGLIVLERRPQVEAIGEDDDATLAELARQVGLALHNVQLDSALRASLEQLQHTNEELRTSRARIVAAGDAERRKLERNLHDGAQQHLVAMAVKLRLARDAVRDDPDDATALLDELGNDVKDAVAELRALAHGIFPPLLVSGGLAEALPSVAARAALPVELHVDITARPTPEIEAVVYFCVLEALQNAGKHAGGDASSTVRVWSDAESLRFEVVDDGVGFSPDSSSAGHGFVNMIDRLGAYGGRVEVWSEPGHGVRIGGWLPLGG